MVIIEDTTVNDAALIADLSRQTFYETFAKDNSKEDMEKFLAEQFTRATLMMEVGLKENYFYLAKVDNKVAGYVKLRNSKRPEALNDLPSLEIARLYATKEMIGKGVGKALMEKSLSVAQSLEKKVIWLGVWEKNLTAINFYRRWGFEKFGEWDFLLGNDLQRDWLMMKHL